MAFGLTNEGFNAKRLSDIKLDIEQDLRSRLGNRINLLPASVFAQIVGVMSERLSTLWELAEAVNNSQYPDTAFGTFLDEVAAITGIVRQQATKSRQEDQLLFGTVGTVIPQGTVFSVEQNPDARFVTNSEVTLVAGQNEIQTVSFDAVPDSGSFRFVHLDEETAAINFDDDASDIQAALNSLNRLEGVTVTGSFSGGFTIEFDGNDGLQNQPELTVTDNSLESSSTPVAITVATSQEGQPQGQVDLTAENTGPIQAPAETLTVIETPVAGLDRTENPQDAIVGRNKESDLDLRLRREQNLQIAGAATIPAIISQLNAITDVLAVVVFQNNSNVVDSEGRPPHSVDIVVQGGDEDQIATTIFETVAAGIETIGDITKTVVDSQGFGQTIKFSRPTEVEIWLEVDLTVNSNIFPSDGEQLAENNFLAFGNSLTIGQDVIVFPSLLCALTGDPDLGIERIPGIVDVAIRIGTSASPTSDDNISIDPREIAVFDSTRITVTTV